MADRYALALAEVAELASELAEARRDLGLQPDDAARPEAIAARLRTEAALRETRPAEAPTTAAPPTEEDDGGAAVERAERAATAKRRRKRSLVPPGSAAADAERLLSTHRLGKTGQHFVCAASLGPRGGPAAEAAREADRAKRRLRAEEAWSAVELRRTRKRDGDNPGPASHAVTYEAVKKRHASATLGPATKNARAVSQARPRAVPAAPDGAAPDGSACEKCYATCWYGCDCDCHEQHGGDDDDDESQGDPQEYDLQVEAEVEAEVVSPGRRGDNRKPPPMRQPGPPPRKTKLAPPLWLCALLQRAAVDEDFRVEFVELEKGLRRAQDARPDDAKHGLGLKFLAAVRATHETVEGWFKSGDDDLRERLTKANLTEEDLNALFGGSVTWAKIETVLGTVLAPWHVSTRLKRALDARKLRLADVFRRAQDQDGLVSANALAAAIVHNQRQLPLPSVVDECLGARRARPPRSRVRPARVGSFARCGGRRRLLRGDVLVRLRLPLPRRRASSWRRGRRRRRRFDGRRHRRNPTDFSRAREPRASARRRLRRGILRRHGRVHVR
ncbi:hypothetical protein M885DRAFT_227272 [Pelagophyceae sp. CCMP2097]|nr:hypothetical protein M885DRAFT_227272 [Pelagophyceae sp. CCMP2097]